MQETLVRSLFQEDPTCQSTKPMHHSHWSPCALEPVIPQREAITIRSPHLQDLEKKWHNNEDPAQPKTNKSNLRWRKDWLPEIRKPSASEDIRTMKSRRKRENGLKKIKLQILWTFLKSYTDIYNIIFINVSMLNLHKIIPITHHFELRWKFEFWWVFLRNAQISYSCGYSKKKKSWEVFCKSVPIFTLAHAIQPCYPTNRELAQE